MQPQGHVQVITGTVDGKMSPQAALDAPRWQWINGKNFEVESHFPEKITDELKRRGHSVAVAPDSSAFGRGQIIWRDRDSGVLSGGTEIRTDGAIAGW